MLDVRGIPRLDSGARVKHAARLETGSRPDPRPAALSRAIPGRDRIVAQAAAMSTGIRGDRARRRLLRHGGVVRLRSGALRGFAAGRRAAFVPSGSPGRAGGRRRGARFFVPAPDAALHRPRRRPSCRAAPVVSFLKSLTLRCPSIYNRLIRLDRSRRPRQDVGRLAKTGAASAARSHPMPAGDRPEGAESGWTTHLHRSERVFAEVDGVLDTAPDAGGGSPGTGGVADLTEFSRVLVEIGLIDAGRARVLCRRFRRGSSGPLARSGQGRQAHPLPGGRRLSEKEPRALDRQLPHPRQARPGGNGRGLQGPPPPAGAGRGAQDPAPVVRARP